MGRKEDSCFVTVRAVAGQADVDVCYVERRGSCGYPGRGIEARRQMTEDGAHPGGWIPVTEADRIAVRAQLERMLASPLFRNSRRYPSLLRFLVEQTLAGNDALLKERTLGVTVFHRAPDYDTNQDTVVRLTASEVRKRIAQYYHQPEHAAELQIDLIPGTYVPVFRKAEPAVGRAPSADGMSVASAAEESEARPVAGPELLRTTSVPGAVAAPAAQRAAVRQWAAWIVGASAVLAAIVGTVAWRQHDEVVARSAEHQLWEPILQDPGQVQLVLSDLSGAVSSAALRDREGGVALSHLLQLGEMVNYRDTLAEAGIVAFLAHHNKPYALALSTQASYPELQRGASVLVGGLSNVWTMRVTAPLRFHFVRRGNSFVYGIEDRKHPEMGGWNVNMAQSFDRATEDYALVARIFDQTTGQPVLVVAGLGANGTNAAAEFLLDPERAAELTAHAPQDWERLNMEAVIRTQILDNHAGPPHLATCVFW